MALFRLFLILNFVLPIFFASCTTLHTIQQNDEVTTFIPDQSSPAPGLILIIHGANASATTWPIDYENILRTLPNNHQWDIFRANWPDISNRYLSAPRNSWLLGQLLGLSIAHHPNQYQVIHIIASSMGAHVAQSLIETYRSEVSNLPSLLSNFSDIQSPQYPGAIIHLTLLDPFLFRDIFRPAFGRFRFGQQADFVDNYYSRRDPVLFTNRPINYGLNFRIDNAIPQHSRRPYFTYEHDYPMNFYQFTINPETLSFPSSVAKSFESRWNWIPGFQLSPLVQSIFDSPVHYFEQLEQFNLHRGLEIILP